MQYDSKTMAQAVEDVIVYLKILVLIRAEIMVTIRIGIKQILNGRSRISMVNSRGAVIECRGAAVLDDIRKIRYENIAIPDIVNDSARITVVVSMIGTLHA